MKIGTSKYGGAGKKKNYFRLKDGESVFRILPPLGDLADEGRWSVFYNVHYGYKNPAGKARPFQSPLVKNRKTKMVEVPDAALERIESLKAELEKAKLSKNKTAVDAILKLAGGPKSNYNLDSNHYMNVVDEQGNIGVLKLRHRCKTALDATIKELRDKGIDPLSVDNGRFFSFRRTGMGLDTSFQVTVKKQKMVIEGVGEVEKDIVHILSEEIKNRLKDEAVELNKLFREPTAAEVEQIVANTDVKTGVCPNIDEILGYGQKSNNFDSNAEVSEEPEPELDSAADYTAPTPQPTVAAKTTANKTTTKVSAQTVATTAPTTSESIAEMDEDEFLASLGINN